MIYRELKIQWNAASNYVNNAVERSTSRVEF